MAAAVAGANTTVPSSQRCAPGSVNIPMAAWPEPTRNAAVDAEPVVSRLVKSFNEAVGKKDADGLRSLFKDDSYIRDHLCLTWNPRTVKGRDAVVSFLLEHGQKLKQVEIDNSSSFRAPHLMGYNPTGSSNGIIAYTTVTTVYGSGRGVIRLADDKGEWKIWTFFTSLEAITGHDEPVGVRRARGVEHGANSDRKNWLDRRVDEVNFINRDPDVLILGAGQAGLSVHARLKMLNVSCLGIDSGNEVGDNWRRRYHQLVLHDPIWYDHLPYINFPKFWPVFTPKDKLADFLKLYAEMLELNIWTRTSMESATWDEGKKLWTVVLKRTGPDGSVETRTLHPKHVIQATGHSGKKNLPQVKGMETFKGDTLCHSSEFIGAKPDGAGRKAVVIGSCNSAMDICQDYYEKGYDITVVQRSSTVVVSNPSTLKYLIGELYSEAGPPVEDADLLVWSMPSEVFKAFHKDLTKIYSKADEELLNGLDKAGFKTDRGIDDCGLFIKYLQRGGGYYIDVGTAQLIVDGKVKVKHGSGVAEVLPTGVKLEDGTELQADEVVFATGYQDMRTATQDIFGDAVAARVGRVWGFDEEGEMRTVWNKSGHPGLWLHGGNLAMCRYFSKQVALQIKAQLEGLDL